MQFAPGPIADCFLTRILRVMMIDGLFHSRHMEIRAGTDTRGPARGDGLQLGIEVDALHAVDVNIAEQGTFPSTETVECHRHGDRYVDAHHACLYP